MGVRSSRSGRLGSSSAAGQVAGAGVSSLTRRRLLGRGLRALLGGGAAAALVGGSVSVAQVYRFGVTRLTRPLPGLRSPLRVVFLTDLHFGPYIGLGSVRAWVRAAQAERPDLVLLGGDQFDGDAGVDADAYLDALGRLSAPLGVYGVWGNHDYDHFHELSRTATGGGPVHERAVQQRERPRLACAEHGLTLLRNEGRALRPDLYLGGVDDVLRGQPDVASALAGADGRATLLVSHNPDLLPELPQSVGLVLCGHTHGGQVRLPGLGAPVVPSRYGQRYAMGWVEGAGRSPAYVSRGLGVSMLPLRLLCPPELVVLTLVPA